MLYVIIYKHSKHCTCTCLLNFTLRNFWYSLQTFTSWGCESARTPSFFRSSRRDRRESKFEWPKSSHSLHRPASMSLNENSLEHEHKYNCALHNLEISAGIAEWHLWCHTASSEHLSLCHPQEYFYTMMVIILVKEFLKFLNYFRTHSLPGKLQSILRDTTPAKQYRMYSSSCDGAFWAMEIRLQYWLAEVPCHNWKKSSSFITALAYSSNNFRHLHSTLFSLNVFPIYFQFALFHTPANQQLLRNFCSLNTN